MCVSTNIHASMCEGHGTTFRSPRDPIQVIRYCGKAFYTLIHLTGPEMSSVFVFVCCNKVSCKPSWPEFAM